VFRRLLIITVVVLCLTPGGLEAASRITAQSVVVLGPVSDRVLYAKAPQLRHAPASTTKLLTAMVAIDRLDLDNVVRVPRIVRSIPPSKVYLRPGERYKVGALIQAMLMRSANDAAAVLAIATAGSRKSFAELMNRKARSIGCEHSNFVRPNGLPARGQATTAYDMALISRAAANYDFIVETMETKHARIQSESGRRIALKNSNRLLWQSKYHVLGKTGFTRRAHHCFVGIVESRSGDLFVAVLGSRSRTSLWRDVRQVVRRRLDGLKKTIMLNNKLWSDRTDRRTIQANLRKAGFEVGPLDGVFGIKTISAIRAFQSSVGLLVDGVVGKKTWRALTSELLADDPQHI
jgi:D-alanyl-D-alanine carboxypeptidase (penicillin-binding protein 5/6)